MTRINANIRPEHLIDQHLVAEYREIVRIPNVVLKMGPDNKRTYPEQFKLGTGHVVFFYNKIKFLHKRFLDLKQEMRNRVIANNMDDEMFMSFKDNVNWLLYYNDIHSSKLAEGNVLIVDRIIERISTMKRAPTISGNPIDVQKYIVMMREYYNF